jgi:alpha-L-rhamnosidase
VNGEVKSAKVYVNTPCLYELYINGKKVGDDVLMPAYAHTQKRAFYNFYDVSHLLKKGANCIALWMGPGWFQHSIGYSAPIVRAQLEIESSDGASMISTDDQWRTADSCITQLANWEFNNFGGERYDAGKYLKDWNLPTADDSAWA